MKPNYKTIEDRIKIASDIDRLITEKKYVTAGIAVESLPADFPKSSIYAVMALSLADDLEGKKTEGMSFDLIKRMIEYCKGKTEYFGQ